MICNPPTEIARACPAFRLAHAYGAPPQQLATLSQLWQTSAEDADIYKRGIGEGPMKAAKKKEGEHTSESRASAAAGSQPCS